MPYPSHRFCIIASCYYEAISNSLIESAIEELKKRKQGEHEFREVPGAFEIPAAIALAEELTPEFFDGYIALGCVIRGETEHFEIVAHQSARALMDLTYKQHIIIGNGILTVENMEQAIARADPKGLNKGGEAASAAIRMADYRHFYSPKKTSQKP